MNISPETHSATKTIQNSAQEEQGSVITNRAALAAGKSSQIRKNSVVPRLQSPTVSVAGPTTAYSKKLPQPKLVYVVDFFSGCGGMSWGFANTRQSHLAYKVLLGVDINRVALETYRTNVKAPTLCEDIRVLAEHPEILEQAIGTTDLKSMRPLVFVGCPPCQGFSAHRKKDPRDDPRNDLAVAFAKLCDHFRPDVVVMENVPEMLKGRFENYFTQAAKLLKKSGYHLTSDVLDLSRFGVPQKRLRAVVFGGLESPIPLPKPLVEQDAVLTVRDAIGHLAPLEAGEINKDDPHHQAPAHVARILSLIRRIPKDGGDRRSLPDKSQLRCHTKMDGGKTPGFTDVYGRLRWDTPAVTITAKSSTPSCGRFLHPEQDRNISVREAAILQGFPQSYVFEGPFVNKYRQIGEAVPPKFAQSIARQVLNYLNPEPGRSRPVFSKAVVTKRRPAIGLVDAFCGAGGLSLGFEHAGFKTLYAFDSNVAAIQTFNENLQPKAEVADITNKSIVERIDESTRAENPYVIVGGPPCQGFSQQRRGEDIDSRNNLVVRFAEVIGSLSRSPAAVILENVTYLDSPRGALVFTEYVRLLEKLGYIIFRHDLNSAEFAVPQLRRRIIVVALRKIYASAYAGPIALTPKRWPTLGEALCDLSPAGTAGVAQVANHTPSKEGAANKRRIMFVDMGKGRLAIPEKLQLNCHKRYGGHLDVYGRLDWFSQARTITGGFDSFTRGEFAHPFIHRSITPREAARIQGFPDWFKFEGNRAAVRQQIGNAVPPPMAYAIAKSIAQAIAS